MLTNQPRTLLRDHEPNDVIEATAAFKSSVIFPIHHDGWAHFTQSQEELVRAFTQPGILHRLQVVEPGKTYTFVATQPNTSGQNQ